MHAELFLFWRFDPLRNTGVSMIRYLKNLLLAVDQLLGALLLGTDADMTISAQAWLWHIENKRHWPYLLIDKLFWFDYNHCQESYQSEVQRKHVPESVRRQNE